MSFTLYYYAYLNSTKHIVAVFTIYSLPHIKRGLGTFESEPEAVGRSFQPINSYVRVVALLAAAQSAVGFHPAFVHFPRQQIADVHFAEVSDQVSFFLARHRAVKSFQSYHQL